MSPAALGMLLAVGAAVALNGSYLIQHAGSARAAAVDPRRPLATVRELLRSPVWTLGAVVGCTGWALHVAAMREAPLSLVQAFVAGGLALAVPMAALGFGRPLARAELQGVGLIVVALLALCVGLPHGNGGFAAWRLGAAVAALAAGAGALAAVRRPVALGAAGGLLYGAADLALKAVTAGHALWLGVALAATAGAFFAFQRGLQADRPLAVIAAMTAATNVSSIGLAFPVFGDALGRTPALAAAHAAAFALVIVAAWRLSPGAYRWSTGT